MNTIALLMTATLLGGMVFFSFGFAPVLFAQLPKDKVRPLLRGTFPHYYLAVIVLGAISTGTAFWVDGMAGRILLVITLFTVYARQALMPKINQATDSGNAAAFKRLHGLSVVIQLIQIALCGWALVLIS